VPHNLVLPRVRSVPKYKYSSGDDAIDFARSAGLELDRWQQEAVRDIFAEKPDGKWNTFEAALVLPRQNGKNAVLEAVELAGLFLFGEQLIIHTAHEFKTAQEAFRRIRALVQNTAELADQLKNDGRSNGIMTGAGNEGIELKTGQRLRFLARSDNSGRGFSADRLIYDEAYELSEETVAASLPTMSARPNPQLMYTSSAALDKSTVLKTVMERGRKGGDQNLGYIEYSADPKADLDDHEAWRSANPGIEVGRISIDFIAKERSALSELAFARERLGIVDESKGATVIDLDVWAEAGDPLSSPLDPVSFALDVNPDSSYSSIAVAGRRADGLMHTEVVNRERGTGWVVDRIEELVEKWSPSSVTLDAIGPAGALLPRFAERNIEIDVVSMAQYGQACQGFKNLVDEGQLRFKEQSGLTAALEAARKRPLGDSGAWGWHRRDTTDITPLVAVTLATYAFARNSAPVEEVDSRMIVFR
jgi:hypothetical protein